MYTPVQYTMTVTNFSRAVRKFMSITIHFVLQKQNTESLKATNTNRHTHNTTQNINTLNRFQKDVISRRSLSIFSLSSTTSTTSHITKQHHEFTKQLPKQHRNKIRIIRIIRSKITDDDPRPIDLATHLTTSTTLGNTRQFPCSTDYDTCSAQ